MQHHRVKWFYVLVCFACCAAVLAAGYPCVILHLFGATLLEEPRSLRDVVTLRGEPFVALNLDSDYDKDTLAFLSPGRRNHTWLLLYRFLGVIVGVSCSDNPRGVAYTRIHYSDVTVLLEKSKLNRADKIKNVTALRNNVRQELLTNDAEPYANGGRSEEIKRRDNQADIK